MTTKTLTFDKQTHLDHQGRVTFKVDKQTRTVVGLAVPFGDVGDNGYGTYRFSKGSLDWSKVKLLKDHDWSSAIGTVKLEETAEGLVMTAKVAPTRLGDEYLALAATDEDTGEAVYDGLSIGLGEGARFERADDGVYDCISAAVLEVSGTPIPAFTNAQVRSVAASAAQNKEKDMTEENKENEAPASFSQAEGVALMEKVEAQAVELAALKDIKIPVGPGTAQYTVKEEPIYRFAGHVGAPSGHDFATDLFAAAKNGDGAALKRLQEFTAESMGQTFADQPTTTGDTANINPPTYRPDMFLGQAPTPQSPLYDFFYKGSLDSVQPFFWSKLDRAATDIGVTDHTEGTNPESRDLVTAVGVTVTPAPVSGQVFITREVGDQGGNPQISGLIKNEFDRSFAIARETKTAALLAAGAAGVTALASPAAGAAGDVAGKAIEAGLIGVQFLTDGSRFQKMFGHVDLYTVLAAFENSDGEKRYPIINPQNRSGISGDKYSFLDIAGYRMTPAASLGPSGTDPNNSWLADPHAVHVWASGLKSLGPLQETVAGWNLGVFGYWAGVLYDTAGLRKLPYDKQA